MILARAAAAWLAGIAAAATLGHGAWPLVFALAAVLVAWSAYRRDGREALYAVALPALFALALLRFEGAGRSVAADDVSRYNDGVAMRIRGVLRDDPEIHDTTQRFAIDAREVQIRGDWVRASGGVQVTFGLYPRYESGDVVELEGKLGTPGIAGSFDYGEYLARRGIGSTIGFPRLRYVGHEDDGVVRSAILGLRRSLSDSINRVLPEPQSSLARSVLLGQRSALPQELANELNATNTSHLVVVSGSNVVLVAAFATLLFSWIAGRRRAMVIAIAFVCGYAALVGMTPPVTRALIMGVLLIVARLSGRPTSGLTSILFAAALMTAVTPAASRDVSFQLSFAATAGIVFLSGPIRGWLLVGAAGALRREAMPRWVDATIAEPMAMTLAAIIATEPLIALNFGRVSVVAIPANMLVVPAFGIILGSSLLAAVGGLVPHAHTVLAAPAYYALTYWIEVVRWLASLPHAYTTVARFGPWATTTTYVAITAVAFVLLRRFSRHDERLVESGAPWMRFAPIGMIAAPAAVFLATAAFVVWPEGSRRLRVTVLDVGQGDAILIETPNGRNILVDSGPGPAVLQGLGEQLAWHDRSIDMIVLTHPQADHMYGFADVMKRYDVGRVIAGPGVQPSPGYTAFARAASDEGRRIETVGEGWSFDAGDDVRIEVLGPGAVEAQDREVNNTGVVIKISWRDVSFLLTADVEKPAEDALLASGADLHATVLKVGHHGSKTSSTSAFLAAVQPSMAVVSSGKDNQFGHPRPEVVDRLDDYGPVYNTADRGSVHFETDGARVWVSAQR